MLTLESVAHFAWGKNPEYYLTNNETGEHYIYNYEEKIIKKTELLYHQYCESKGIQVCTQLGIQEIRDYCGKDVKILEG